MNPEERRPNWLTRVLMLAAMCALTVYIAHFILPGSPEGDAPAIVFDPLAQIALFIVLTVFGVLIGFWITFGDLVNRGENKPKGSS